MSAETAFAEAVLARLINDAGVSAVLGGRVHAVAPGGAAFPFAQLGRSVSTPAGGTGAELIDHRLTVHVYARRDDAERLAAALSAIRATLHNAAPELAAPYRCVLCQVVYADRFATSDSRTVQGLVRVRALLEG
jgi:hypothetical protein